MSNFKYRCWADGKMVLPDDPHNNFVVMPDGSVCKWNKDQQRLEPAPSVMPLLYTGPKDQSGAEVCESDILMFGQDKRGEVFYKAKVGAFQVRFAPPKNNSSLTVFLQMNPDAKIIGNIYQNPELKNWIETNDE